MTTSSEITVPKKSDLEIGYAEQARKAIRQAMEIRDLKLGTLFAAPSTSMKPSQQELSWSIGSV